MTINRISLFIFLVYPFIINSQNVTFNYSFNGYERNNALSAVNMKDGNVALVVQGINQGRYVNATLFKLSRYGKIIDSVIISKDTNIVIINKAIKTPIGYAAIGQILRRPKSYFYVAFFDENLKIIKESEKEVVGAIQELTADFDRDSNIIVGGGIDERASGDYTPRLFGAKINKNGDITMVKHHFPILSNIPSPYIGWFDYMQVKKDSSQYLYFDGQKISVVDSNFNVIFSRNMPETIVCPPCDFSTLLSYGFYPTALRINDSIYYVAGKGFLQNERVLYILKMHLYKGKAALKTFKIPSIYQGIALHHSIDTTQNGFIYLGGVYNSVFPLTTPSDNTDTTQFILRKLDRDFNVLWTKQYGKNHFYFMSGVLATDDGGCMMYGQRYNFNSEGLVEGYVLKVDGNGITANETIIPLSISTISASPNPSNGVIQVNIENVSKVLSYRFFDMNGRLIKSLQSDASNPNFDLSFVSSGTYIFTVSDGSNLLGKGKILIQK
jgi:Secretion system C-terminal sorting domain